MQSTSTEAEALRVWFRLLRLETRIRLAMSERLKRLGLSVPQCDVLTTLTEQEGVSQQDLAERLYVTKGNISGLIDRMVAAGLVERRSIAADKRSRAIFLTNEGRKVAEKGLAAQRSFVALTFGQIPPDKLAQFEAALIAARELVRAQAAADQTEINASNKAGKAAIVSTT